MCILARCAQYLELCCLYSLERDPEEEAALAASMNAASAEDLPAQLLFVHLGQVHVFL